jgi:hypothetical protein
MNPRIVYIKTAWTLRWPAVWTPCIRFTVFSGFLDSQRCFIQQQSGLPTLFYIAATRAPRIVYTTADYTPRSVYTTADYTPRSVYTAVWTPCLHCLYSGNLATFFNIAAVRALHIFYIATTWGPRIVYTTAVHILPAMFI